MPISRSTFTLYFSKVLHYSIIFAAFLITGLNALQFNEELHKIYQFKKVIPYSFSGLKFSGLEDIFKDIDKVGYYTDKNLEKNEHAGQFAQAQLVLAPVILELNNLSHEFTLFDCSTPEIAFAKIKQEGLLALKKNKYGIILAKRIK